MKQLFIPITTFLSLLISCNDDNDSTPIAGTYSLVRVSGGLTGGSWNIPPSDVVWNINETNDSVTIANNSTNNIPSAYPSGKYSYNVRHTSGNMGLCDTSLYINNDYFGYYSTSNDTITVSDLYADGYLYIFVRN